MASSPESTFIRAVWEKTDGHCWYCGTNLELFRKDAPIGRLYFMEIDHVIPASRGGPSTLDNLVPACPRCNAEKNNRTVEEYRQAITRHINGVPKFRKNQLAWLEANGFSFPHYPLYQFWAEKVLP